jgi:hypothetical protein
MRRRGCGADAKLIRPASSKPAKDLQRALATASSAPMFEQTRRSDSLSGRGPPPLSEAAEFLMTIRYIAGGHRRTNRPCCPVENPTRQTTKFLRGPCFIVSGPTNLSTNRRTRPASHTEHPLQSLGLNDSCNRATFTEPKLGQLVGRKTSMRVGR